MRRLTTCRSVITILTLLAVLLPWPAAADEGGVPFWFSRQHASLSAVPPQPGWTLALLPYYYRVSASASKIFQQAEPSLRLWPGGPGVDGFQAGL
jgi:hypothetical protein